MEPGEYAKRFPRCLLREGEEGGREEVWISFEFVDDESFDEFLFDGGEEGVGSDEGCDDAASMDIAE